MRWSRWLIPIGLVGVALPLIVAAATGNLSIPHNDAWSYSRIAATFADTGRIQLLNWNRTGLIGQVVLFWPVGSSLVGQQAGMSVLALACLYCIYDLVGATVGTRRAVLAAALVAVWPGWGALATSFMTDIPALVGTFATLAVGRNALARDSRRLFWLALLVALWAATVRQQALAAPCALIVWGVLTRSQRQRVDRLTLALGTAAFLTAFAAFTVWRNSLPYGDHVHLSLQLGHDLHFVFWYSAQSYLTLSFVLAPAIFLTVDFSRWRRASWMVAACALLLYPILKAEHFSPLLGNYLTMYGDIGTTNLGGTPIFGGFVYDLVVVTMVVSGALMAGTVAERWRAGEPMLTLFTLITAAATVVVAATGQGEFDRYLIALVPGVLGVVLTRPAGSDDAPATSSSMKRGVRIGLAGTSFLFIATISALLLGNSFSFDRAMWNAGRSATAMGVPALRADAGLDWLGWHAPHGYLYRSSNPTAIYGDVDFFTRQQPCLVVRSSPPGPGTGGGEGWTLLAVHDYRTFLITGQSALYEYATHAPGCPALRPQTSVQAL